MEKRPIYLQVAREYEKLHKNLTVCEKTYLYVFAPAMTEFIQWLLNIAMNQRRQRLYFLSRDGYQMYLVAKKLTEVFEIPIECRYINVSRYALRVPEYHFIGEKCLDRICLGGIDVTFEKVMKRAGLNDEEAYEIARICEYDKKYRDVLSYQEVIGLKEVLRDKNTFFEYVYAHSKEAYDMVIGYLKQEGMCDDVDYAIVDSGWIGTMQQTLYNLISSTGVTPKMHGYYFGLYDIPKDSPSLYLSYYFEPKSHIRRKVNFSNCLYEAVYTSAEGMTLKYTKNGDRYEPVYENDENPNKEMVEKNILLIEEYIKIYSNLLGKCDILDKLSDKGQKLVYELFKSMMGTPSEEELETFGNILFSDDVLGGCLQYVAADLTDEDIKNQRFLRKALIMLGLRKGIIHESAWIEGSIVRNGKKVKSYLRHARMYKYFVYLKKRFS